MKLLFSPASPFARKVRIVLIEKEIECTIVEESPFKPGNPVSAFSPLGKVPVLVLDDGATLFDSRVIVEYLDALRPLARLLPEPSAQRIAVKRWEALADGVCDAAVALRLESLRPVAERGDDWVERQAQKVTLGVRELAHDLGERPWCAGDAYSLADIATGCALGYLDLRRPQFDWRSEYPNLRLFADKLAQRPSFIETAPPAS